VQILLLMKVLLVAFSFLFFLTCNTDIGKDFSIKIIPKSKKFTQRDTLKFHLTNNKGHVLDSLTFALDGKMIKSEVPLKSFPLGYHKLEAMIYVAGNIFKLEDQITILSSTTPKLYQYQIINEFPHDKTAFTQGLEFYKDTLYESTGLRGKSNIRKVNFITGEVYKQIPLDKVYFGEGITFLNHKLYQLTWKGNIGFQYDPITFKMERSFSFNKSKEGWGLCNDGQKIYKSDGSHTLWILDPKTQEEIGQIQVMTDKSALKKINELEWVDGKIYANTYQFKKEAGIIIDPLTGAVEGVIDFSGLKEKVAQIDDLNVLNGIAYHPKRKTFFVTGKNWSKMFEVKILSKE